MITLACMRVTCLDPVKVTVEECSPISQTNSVPLGTYTDCMEDKLPVTAEEI